MKTIKHKIKPVLQPTNQTCGYAAAATLLSHYDTDISIDDLLNDVPYPIGPKGEPFGSITMQIAEWIIKKGFKTHMYSFDVLVLDLSWQSLSEKQILTKLKAIQGKRDARVINEYWTNEYIKAYIGMLQAGGKLTIQPLVTTKLLYKLLNKGPVYANYCATALHGKGRQRDAGLRETIADDLKGKVSNHSVVIYGNDAKGNFLVVDPWDGLKSIDPETMIGVITEAQIECDNMCFVIEK